MDLPNLSDKVFFELLRIVDDPLPFDMNGKGITKL
jgi:hypothetical protein